jgi:ribosomal protein L11 methyltransferase
MVLKITLEATAEGVDWVRMAVAATEPATPIILEPSTSSSASVWAYQIQLGFADTWEGRQQLDVCLKKLSPLERSGLISTPAIEEGQFSETSLTSGRLGQVGRFVLALPNTDLTLQPEELPLYLPPSLGFGSGNHPATVLSLQLIQRYWQSQAPVQPSQPIQVVDLGCGSGILSLACARLGGSVLALDNDSVAVAATQTAVGANGLASQIRVQTGSLGQGTQFGHWLGGEVAANLEAAHPQAVDLIVANVLARLHLALAPDYAATLKPGGYLITAGFTTDYEAELNTAFAQAGLVLVDRIVVQEWAALMHRNSA